MSSKGSAEADCCKMACSEKAVCVQADVLGREVMAQMKAAAGDEAYLQALVQAKQHATALRRLRRKQQASEVSGGCQLCHPHCTASLSTAKIWALLLVYIPSRLSLYEACHSAQSPHKLSKWVCMSSQIKSGF